VKYVLYKFTKPTTSKFLWLLMLNNTGGEERCKTYVGAYTFIGILFFSDAITSGDSTGFSGFRVVFCM